MQRITFVRHGQSIANMGGESVPHGAIALSPVGYAQAQALVPWLPAQPARVLASPYDRAQVTAQPYSAHWGVAVEVVPELQELDAIAFELIAGMVGTQRAGIAAAWWQAADPEQRTGAGAETFHEFAARVAQFRVHWLDALPDRTVVFGHGIWIAMLCWQLWGFAWQGAGGMQRFKRFQQGWPMPNGAVYHCVRGAEGPWAVQADAPAMAHMQALGQG